MTIKSQPMDFAVSIIVVAGCAFGTCKSSTEAVKIGASIQTQLAEPLPFLEWDRQSHRVMVLAVGFAWNGQTYDSPTKVALAIVRST